MVSRFFIDGSSPRGSSAEEAERESVDWGGKQGSSHKKRWL